MAQQIANIFENIGVVQDGMRSIAVPRQMPDRPDAPNSAGRRAARCGSRMCVSDTAHRGAAACCTASTSTVAPGERVGLVGRRAPANRRWCNLLLRFYDLERGRILIDGQDIAEVTQESLRAQIAHGDAGHLAAAPLDPRQHPLRPAGGDARRRSSTRPRQAQAIEFIEGLEDWHGRRGFDAHVGERGVKLSGGQRQRIAIARVILKDAPILVLDEATSALDSEIEAAIQEQLDGLMKGRTVIAIAHRLSTIARMDRLVVLDDGRIVEQGPHEALLAAGGAYAGLWRRQSGGFRIDRPAGRDAATLDATIPV